MKWYYRTPIVVLAILAAGPFALPLVWKSPALTRWNKILLTTLTILLTAWTLKATADIVRMYMARLQAYGAIL